MWTFVWLISRIFWKDCWHWQCASPDEADGFFSTAAKRPALVRRKKLCADYISDTQMGIENSIEKLNFIITVGTIHHDQHGKKYNKNTIIPSDG